MSLLMDALRRAEAEKKEAAKQKSADSATADNVSAGQTSVKKSSDASQGSSQSPNQEVVEDDEDLGATVKLDRLPLPMAKQSSDGKSPATESAATPTVGDITKSLGDSLDGLSVDFESTSPRLRSDQTFNDQSVEQGSDQESGQESAKVSEHKNQASTSSEKSEDDYDFSIHANSSSAEAAEPLSLEPLQENVIADSEPLPEPILNKTSTLPSSPKPPSGPEHDATLAANDVDPLMISMPGETTLETSSGQTAVSANTVFEAGSSGISRRMILWTLTLGIALFGLLAVTGVYYFQQAPTARPMPSPIASVELEKARNALEIETQLASASKISPEASKQIDPSGSTSTDSEQINLAEQLPENYQTPPTQNSGLGDGLGNEQLSGQGSVSQSAKSVARAADEKLPLQSTPAETASSNANSGMQAAQNPPSRGAPNVDTRRLKIAKSLRGVRSNEQVMAAYRAYQVGDLDAAKLLYEKALSIRPQDINALNGLAALALGDGMQEKAHQLYSRVLKLEPNNPTAAAALFQIEGGAGTHVRESQLKLMLDNGGDSGLINFALGNLYSRHQRWNDAQLAFFEAVRNQPNNADYLYNLAVSLDQIGQRKPALDYYQQALTVADDSTAGFSTADVIARIQAIKQTSSSSAP